MNLRELLLQFAGENEESLQLDELLADYIDGINIEKDIANGVKIVLQEDSKVESVKSQIQTVLEDAGYEEYSITPETEDGLRHIIVIVK